MLAAACILAVIASVAVWHDNGGSTRTTPTTPSGDVVSALRHQLGQLQEAQNEDDFVRAAGKDKRAASWARTAWNNLRLLKVRDLKFRYVSGGQAPIDSADTREARVHITWTPGSGTGFASGTSSATVGLRVRPLSADTVAIAGATGDDGRLPLWLAGNLRRQRSDDVIVYQVGRDDAEFDAARLARRAVTRVRRVLTARDLEPLVVIVPDGAATMAQLLDQADATELAAVTAHVNGEDGPVSVFCNPDVFDSMDERAAQVVMTHEATHALTAAIGESGPPWVLEGFADWVALHDDRAGLAVSAGQILRRVARDGAPSQLPDRDEFAASRDDLGTVYEGAWMVFRMLSERYSDAEIIAFYRAVLQGTDVDAAARDHFGLGVPKITEQWRRYLENKASIVSE